MYEANFFLNGVLNVLIITFNSSAVKHNCFSFIYSMKKGYNTIQDRHRFVDAVTDLVEDYIKYSSDIVEDDGIYVDEDDNVSLMNRSDAPNEADFHSILILLDMSEGMPEVNYEAIQELTDKYIFVR